MSKQAKTVRPKNLQGWPDNRGPGLPGAWHARASVNWGPGMPGHLNRGPATATYVKRGPGMPGHIHPVESGHAWASVNMGLAMVSVNRGPGMPGHF